jgi:mannose-1-phosphate guanylyltransferase/phosphomannomutase
MYATIKIVEMLVKHEVKLSDLVKEVERFYYHQTKIECSQALKGKMMRKFLEDSKGKRSSSTDGVKIWLNETDWILMIPDQYRDHLNLFIQAKDEASGKAIIQAYEDKINGWAKA